METFTPAIVVKLLADFFGLSNAMPCQGDLIKFDQIKNELLEDDLIVEEIHTLVHDDLLSSDEDIDSDSEDDTITDQEQQSPKHESSSSSYAPSPKRAQTMFPEGYLADAYKIWTKQPRAKDGNTDPPQLCLPGLAIDSSPRVSFKTVMTLKRKIKNKTVLQKFEQGLKMPAAVPKKSVQQQLNRELFEYFLQMRAQHAIIHDRTIKLWAIQIKNRIDAHNQLQFKASDSWVTKFKKRNKIVSRKITHKVGKAFCQESRMLEVTAKDFVGNVQTFVASHEIRDEDVLNANQSRFEKELHSGRTLAVKGMKRIFGLTGSISATTHSYMIMPVITMAGTLLPHMYVLVSEPNGKFPSNMT